MIEIALLFFGSFIIGAGLTLGFFFINFIMIMFFGHGGD